MSSKKLLELNRAHKLFTKRCKELNVHLTDSQQILQLHSAHSGLAIKAMISWGRQILNINFRLGSNHFVRGNWSVAFCPWSICPWTYLSENKNFFLKKKQMDQSTFQTVFWGNLVHGQMNYCRLRSTFKKKYVQPLSKDSVCCGQ